MASGPSKVIDGDLWLEDDEKVPQILDEGLREESFTLFNVVFFKNLVAGESDFMEVEF